ncbi:MAG: hypothetical protein HQL52_14135 [Magnetococcales bacterium]|nr:hypothetical protein [Magnetococcales bacterium]
MNKLRSFFKTAERPFLWLTILGSFGLVVYGNYPVFLNDYLQTDDARANIFWLHRLVDPELLQNDLLTDYAIYFEALGPKYLYTFASHFMDPFLLEKLIPLFLFTVTGILLFQLGNHLNGPYAGFLFALTFLALPNHMENFNAGFSRTFAYPSAILFIYLLTTRRLGHLLWLFPLTALFYPIVFLINSTVYFFWVLIRITWKPIDIPRQKIMLYAMGAILLSAPCILPKYLSPDDRFGRLMNHEETINHPGAYQYGHTPILPPEPYHEKVLDKLDEPFIILAFLVIFFFLGRRGLDIPLEFWLYMGCGWLLYELAYPFLLTLYLPYKYFRYSFLFIIFFIISLGLGRIISNLPTPLSRNAGLALVMVFAVHFYGKEFIPGGDFDDYSPKAPLYLYLMTLPKDALFAAPPYLADDIPLFAARKVLINYELATPWFVNYWQTIKERTEDFYSAYYTNRLSELIAFRDKYQIDYLIVNRRDFHRLNRKRFYFNPFNDFIKEQIKKNRPHFFLSKHTKQLSQFKLGSFYVIDTKRLDGMKP